MKAFNSSGAKLWRLLLPMLAFILLSATPTFAQNDDCSGATAVQCGDTVIGNNADASNDSAPACGQQALGFGEWYTVVGNGGDITVSTCNSGTNFDTQLSIYTGSCDDLTCLANNNNTGDCDNVRASIVTFPSEAGVTYYILAGGALGARGDYVMTVTCTAPPITNDECADAAPIGCNETISATTSGATNTGAPSFCGTSLTSAPGVWYAFAGTGDDIVVTTCGAGTNYDTKMGVFSGSCGSLTCVGGDDDDFGCGFSTLQSVVEFSSEVGTTYYIYVTGFSTSSGSFDLSLTCTPPPPDVDNDTCDDAIAIDCNSSITGTNAGATPASVAFCGTSLTTSGGVWYSVEGNGGEITATTCNPGTNFDTKLGVFSGTCSGLVCVGGNDDQTGGTDPACVVTTSSFNRASTVTWASTAGTTYYILVTGFSTNEGDFELSVSCEDVGGGGGDDPLTCADAISVECGDVVTGDTNNGQINNIPNCDGEGVSSAKGVWYVIEGADVRVTASTCSDVTDYDSKIAVFSGSCDDLVCVAANNNDPGCGTGLGVRNATVEFAAFAGTTYYIYVTGQTGSEGVFEMSIECAILNDDCVDALPISCGESASGSTTNANPDNGLPFCGTTVSGRRGAWYVLEGTGTSLTASTCNAGTNYDTKLAVFEGSCGDLICVGGNDDSFGCGFSILRSTVTFTAAEGTTYYILVTGFGTFSTGNYQLSVTGDCGGGGGGGGDQDGIIDDVCDADDLEINTSYGFSNVGATAQPGEPNPGPGTAASSCNSTDGWCSFELDVDNSVWFKFVAPASGCINASANTIDYQLAIWSVGDCNDFGTFTEVAANDDSGPGLSPLLENLAVTPGATYYVQVDGYNGASSASGLVLVQDCGAGNLVGEINTLNLIGNEVTGWAITEVFPNPTAGAPVSLDLNAPRDVPGEIFLMDNLGRVLTNQKQMLFQGANRIQIEMDNLAPGMYFLNIVAGEETFQKKVMVVRP